MSKRNVWVTSNSLVTIYFSVVFFPLTHLHRVDSFTTTLSGANAIAFRLSSVCVFVRPLAFHIFKNSPRTVEQIDSKLGFGHWGD